MPSTLLVEDDPSSLAALQELIQAEGFRVTTASSASEARATLAKQLPDLLIADLVLPDGSGMDLLQECVPQGGQVVLITGHASIETAVDALRLGATDYLTKPIDVPRLKAILANVSRTRALQHEIGSLRGELRKLGRLGPLVGSSPAMREVYDLIQKVAPTDASVVILGESGTGKEMVAQAVHELSRRRNESFLPVNCGAMTPTLIESTLFGHEKGSFTGAERQHRGVFEQASGGTLFLDEITEMPQELQIRLLRVLETGEVTRVGSETAIPVDTRLLSATNREPAQAISEGRLREDLWYRLNVFTISLPPLRERVGDIELLARHFLAALNEEQGTDKRFTDAALRRMEAYSWPGNVRELKNALQRAFILSAREIDEETVPTDPKAGSNAAATASKPAEDGSLRVRVGSTVADVERQLLLATLAHCQGNKQKTAGLLGISLKTLYNRLAQYRDAERGES